MLKNIQKTAESTKYPFDAFLFIQRGLDYAVRHIHGETNTPDETTHRHISGDQLCHGLRNYAMDQYGLMARTVLQRWRINSCEDFGNIVFALVESGLMHKTDEDSIDDFIGVFDFNEAFTPNLQLSEKP